MTTPDAGLGSNNADEMIAVALLTHNDSAPIEGYAGRLGNSLARDISRGGIGRGKTTRILYVNSVNCRGRLSHSVPLTRLLAIEAQSIAL